MTTLYSSEPEHRTLEQSESSNDSADTISLV